MEIQSSARPIEGLMEKVLSVNILSSDYFKELFKYKTYHEVVDEIYNQVDHVEPWMTGNCRGPSSAFCLLYKFFTMKLTVKQMHGHQSCKETSGLPSLGFLFNDLFAVSGFTTSYCMRTATILEDFVRESDSAKASNST
jgi:pre-mRNA-splicing factor 38B